MPATVVTSRKVASIEFLSCGTDTIDLKEVFPSKEDTNTISPTDTSAMVIISPDCSCNFDWAEKQFESEDDDGEFCAGALEAVVANGAIELGTVVVAAAVGSIALVLVGAEEEAVALLVGAEEGAVELTVTEVGSTEGLAVLIETQVKVYDSESVSEFRL